MRSRRKPVIGPDTAVGPLTPHKDHFHDARGVKVLGVGSDTDLQNPGQPKAPTEVDIAQERLKTERRQQRRYGNKGYLSTVLQSRPGNKLG